MISVISAITISLTLLLAGCVANDTPRLSPAATPSEAGLVDIATLSDDFIIDMRYAGDNNFIGERIDGYEAPRCYLLQAVADALVRVADALKERQLRLKVFDCYRPARAVRHFVDWAADPDDQRQKAAYYPGIDKSELMGVYIAPVSGHSRGATIDLTLASCENDRCRELDMGTTYDFFDELAHTDNPRVSERQRANRNLLRTAMEQQGFRNYELEWWHYTLSPEPAPHRMYDVPVR